MQNTWAPWPHCGIERWPVKTGTDPDAVKVGTSAVVDTTVPLMASLPPPPSTPPQDARVAPVELTVYRVRATLTGYKLEADGDYHLIIADGGKQMIAEIPDPACVSGGPLLTGIEVARHAFDQQFTGPAAPSPDHFTSCHVQVTITGAGFYDRDHGQDGRAYLGGGADIELHPVQSIEFG